MTKTKKTSVDGSHWIKVINTAGTIRGVAIQATSLVRELTRTHQLTGIHAQALGEAAVAGLLLGSGLKGAQRVNLNIRGSGVCHQGLIDAYADGAVRGYIVPRDLAHAQKGDGQSAGHWGTGLLSVLRTAENEVQEGAPQKPYIGTVPLVTGSLAKDLSFYLLQSEQIPSAVGIAVTQKKDGTIEAAGGFLVQALPGASAEAVAEVEKHIQEIQSLAKSVSGQETPLQLLGQIFQESPFMVIDEKNLELRCNCSEGRVMRALALIGMEEIQDILNTDGQAVVNCDFCSKAYTISGEKLKKMISN